MNVPKDPMKMQAVFIRLTPELLSWVWELTHEIGGSFANTVRVVLEAAREEGVTLVPNPALPADVRPRRRRRRVHSEPEQAASA